jgi:Xaa-Pro dipeptidase
MQTSINITPAEFQTRAAKLLDHVRAQGLSGVVLFDNYYILYFTGFAFIPTERPIAFVMNAQGEKAMFVPRLEVEHAESKTGMEHVDHYVEYPFDPHPALVLKKTLDDLGIRGKLGADSDGYPWILGYRGPALSELTGATVVRVAGFIEDLMMIKSETEVALIRESVKWGNLAHRLLQRYTRVGATETEVSLRASHEATLAMLDTLGPLYRAQSIFWDGASADYRGQIGRTARPERLQRCGGLRARVEHGELMACLEDIGRHGSAHVTGAYEAHVHRSLLRVRTVQPKLQAGPRVREASGEHKGSPTTRHWRQHETRAPARR